MQINYQVLWRYFGWCNQALSVFTLWAITMYLARKKKMYIITMIPALFMTMVCVTYILFAPEGFTFDNAFADYLVAKYPNLEGLSLDYWLSLGIATLVSLSFVGSFYKNINKKEH
jgi:carbon starvation protein CstA